MCCNHVPECPQADAKDAIAAVILVDHCEQGWYLLCNGVVLFDDGGCVSSSTAAETPAIAA